MRRKNTTLQICLYLIAAVILVTGLAGAGLAYLTAADDDTSNAIGYEIVGGRVYAITSGDYKRDRRDVELYGGTAAVVADEFNQWFAGLWHGKRLAYTLAVLATGVSLACFWAAHHQSHSHSQDRDE